MKLSILLYNELKLLILNQINIIYVTFPLIFYIFILGPFYQDGVRIDQEFNINKLWLSLLLTLIISLDCIFEKEIKNYRLHLLFLTAIPFETLILIKSYIHWLVYIVPSSSPIILHILVTQRFNFYIQLFLILIILLSTFSLTLLAIFCYSLLLHLYNKTLILLILLIPIFFFFIAISNILILFIKSDKEALMYNFLFFLTLIIIVSSYILPRLITKIIKNNLNL